MDSYAEWLHTVKTKQKTYLTIRFKGSANEMTLMKNSEGKKNYKKNSYVLTIIYTYTCILNLFGMEKRISLRTPLKWDCLILISVSCL